MLKRNLILICLCYLLFWELIPIASAGEVMLAWDPPTTDSDGYPLTDLGGYKVYYGTASGTYNTSINVNNVTSWTVTNLSEGRGYYFAVTAYDIAGNESDFSNEVIKRIPGIIPGNIDTITPGSVNRVDGYDLIALERAFGTTPVSANWNPLADIDGNGMVDQQDLGILIGNFGAVE